jgi:hypothetical protein
VAVCDRFLNQESVGRIVLDQRDRVSMQGLTRGW